MTPEQRAWIFVGALKLVAPAIFGLVYWKKLPPFVLIFIPLLYIGVGLMALLDKVMSAAAFCGIILVVGTIVYFAPGPIHTVIMRAMNRE